MAPPAPSFKEKLAQRSSLLSSITDEIRTELTTPKEKTILAWTLEHVQAAWLDFMQTIQSDFTKSHYRNAKLELTDKDEQLKVTVPNPLAKDEIQRNNALITFLKEKFGKSVLYFDIHLVEAAPNPAQKSLAAMTPEEKRKKAEQMLTEENPLVQELKNIFGLEFKAK